MKMEIEKLTKWGEPRELDTKAGRKRLRTGPATPEFWTAWRAGKDALRAAGVSCSKNPKGGEWEACWWLPLDAATVQAQEQAIEASKAATAEDVWIPAPEGFDYLPFQKAGIALMATRANNLLGDEMGLGKTVQAIGIINSDVTIRKVLVICPASLKRNWQRELERWLVRKLSVGIQDSTMNWIGFLVDIVILNYDIALKFEKHLAQTEWDLFVCDECHYLKNPKAQRTQVILGKKKSDHVGIKAKRRVFMSGTPIVNRPIELFPILNALDPNRWPSAFKYGIRYCAGTQGRWGWDFSGASHLDELQRELRATIMVRRLKKDVLTELPPKRRQIIELPDDGLESLVADEAAQYERLEQSLTELRARIEVAALADDDAQYAELSAKLQKATMVAFEEMSKTRHAIALAKLPMVIEHIRGVLDEEDKVVVMAHHREAVDGLTAAFQDVGAVYLYGGMTEQAKDNAVQAFQNDPKCRVFVGGIKAAGVGLTLTAASHVIFAELDWVPGVVTQAEDRCHRYGQQESVLIQHLVLEGSLDARMVKFIVQKQEVIDRALDKGAMKLEAKLPVLNVTVDSVIAEARPEAEEKVKDPGDELRALVHSGLRQLAGTDTDYASEINGVGFNKFDGVFGHALAERDRLTDKMVMAGIKLCVKYRKQLGAGFSERLQGLREKSGLTPGAAPL